MKTDLARVSISLDDALLENFDAYVDDRGYATRSEAIRDLIREKLLELDLDDDERKRVGVVSLVYEQNHPELMARLVDKQSAFAPLVLATTQVLLGERHCLQVSILKGPAGDLRRLADSLLATKGVLHGELRLTGDDDEFAAFSQRQMAGGLATRIPGD